MGSPEDEEKDARKARAKQAFQQMRDRVEELEGRLYAPIAIVGMACRFPAGADSVDAYWNLLTQGLDANREIPRDRWDHAPYFDLDKDAPGKTDTGRASFLRGPVDTFDGGAFKMAPAEIALMDPQQRLLLEIASEALADAGIPRTNTTRTRTGVFVGIMNFDFALGFSGATTLGTYSSTGSAHSIAANRISYLLDLRGPSVAVDTACSSSLVAIHFAMQALRLGECNQALAGGVNLLLSAEWFVSLSKLGAISPDGRCKTFDASANGYGRGEGAGMLVLKRLSDALADGDRIWGLIRGSATNQDGASSGLTVPNGRAQKEVIRAALENARLKPPDVQYVETHGTGTLLGDPIEVGALVDALGPGHTREKPLVIGAVKTNIGHLESAAGVAGVIKAILAIRHGEIPATINVRKPNPHILWDEIPLRVQTELSPWPETTEPKVAGISSFGIGGTNAHVIVSEPPPEAADRWSAADALAARDDEQLLVISARSPEALREHASAYAAHLGSLAGRPRQGDDGTYRDVCTTAALRRDHHAERLAVVGRSMEDFAQKLARYAAGDASSVVTGSATPARRRCVWVFGGQGPQWWGMGRELIEREPVFRETIARCDAAMKPHSGWSLLEELGADETRSRLSQTEVAQPALFAIQMALAAMWRSWGVEPDAVVGHSIGEVAAACTAGMLDLDAAARLVVHRGRCMQKATGLGKMAQVELTLEEATALVSKYEGRLAVGASNGPRTTVLSGEAAALGEALTTLAGRGVYARELPVQYAFHSATLDPFVDELAASLAWLTPRAPEITFVSTMTGATSTTPPDARYWAKQMREPVRFYDALRTLLGAGHELFIEIGPHPVLTASIEETALAMPERSDAGAVVVASLHRKKPERETLLGALGAVHAAGYPVAFSQLYDVPGRVVTLPPYPWQRERYVDEEREKARRPAHDRLGDLVYETVWQSALRGAPKPSRGRWLVLTDEAGHGAQLVEALRAKGERVLRVSSGPSFRAVEDGYEIDPTAADGFTRLFAEQITDEQPCAGIVHMFALDACPTAKLSVGELENAGLRGPATALRLAQALGASGRRDTPRVWLVTRGAQAPEVSSTDSIAIAQAPLWGLGATLQSESPELRCTLVDLDPQASIATAVAALEQELSAPDDELRIALRREKRMVARLAHAPRALAPESTPLAPLPDDTSYLVTGGLRGLGLRVAEWLVDQGARKLVLFARSAPGAETQATLTALEGRGVVVKVQLGDVAREEDVRDALAAARSLGPLRGIVHAAGLLDDDRLDRLTPERLAKVAAPKVLGAWNLHAASQGDELAFFVLFSSLAGVIGTFGQASYAAANAFLDALAHHRRVGAETAVSIDWGPWSEIGMAARTGAEEMEAFGFSAIAPDDGLTLFGRLLARTPPAQVIAAAASFRRWTEMVPGASVNPLFADVRGPKAAETRGRVDAETAELVSKIRTEAAPERLRLVTSLLTSIASQVLGMDAQRLTPTLALRELGLESIMALKLRNRLEATLGVSIKIVELWNHPTIADLARFLCGLIAPTSDASQPETARVVSREEPIAIIGMACRFPGGAVTPDAFWSLLAEGRDAIVPIPAERWNRDAYYDPQAGTHGKMVTRWGGFLDDVGGFEPAFFGIAPREVLSMDPQQRIALEVVWEAIADAGQRVSELARGSTSVFMGVGPPEYGFRLSTVEGTDDAYFSTGNASSIVANRISYVFDFSGPSVSIDTACSSSLVSVHLASESLRTGESDVAIAGGVSLLFSPKFSVALSQIHALSPDGRCRTGDARANGYVRSEGCGVLVLKRLADAERDGDRIHAVIRGSAVAQDGASAGLTAPNGRAQERVIRRALARANVSPRDVGYVELHGTGTPLGDPIEVVALGNVMSDGHSKDAPLIVGSVKSNLGHLEPAAGVAGLIKATLALKHRAIPASIHFEQPNPNIPFSELPIRFQTELGTWESRGGQRIAGVSSFGFGGTVAHVVLSEAPASTDAVEDTSSPVTEPPLADELVLTVSAKSPEALRAYAGRYADLLADGPKDGTARDVCFTAAARVDPMSRRLVVVGAAAELPEKLRAFAAGELREGVTEREARVDRSGPVWVFSGQGTQWWGMGRELMAREPVFREQLERCDAAMRAHASWSLLDELTAEESRSRLAETEIAQPAIFAIQLGLAAMWRSWGIEPSAVVGHSVGEIAAAYVAGALDLEAAARLVVLRGKTMQRATGLGKMAHVALAGAKAAELVAPYADRLAVGAENGPEATVLSGEAKALTAVLETLQRDGIFVKELAVNYAFHSPQLDPFVGELTAALSFLAPGATSIPLYSTVTGALTSGEQLDAAYWARQMRAPVRFLDATRALLTKHDVFIEIGPHPALATAIEDTARSTPSAARADVAVVASLRRSKPERASLLEALGQLHAAGSPVDWARFYGAGGVVVSLPSYPWQRQRYLIDPPSDTADDRSRWLFELAWRESTRAPEAAPRKTGGRWLVFADDGGVGQALTTRLREAGERVTLVSRASSFRHIDADHVEIDGTASAYERVIADVIASGDACRGVVHLFALDAEVNAALTLASLETAQRAGSASALLLTQALARAGFRDAPRLWLVTRGAACPTPDTAVAVAQAPLWGFGTTVASELPELDCTLVDLAPAGEKTAAAAELAAELRRGDRETRVALRGAKRHVARLVQAPRTHLESRPSPVRDGATYLVTGGLSGIGLGTAEVLASRGARHIVLVARSAPSEAARETMSRLEAQGVSIRVASVDVTSRDAVAALLDDLRKTMPPLAGIIHSAAVFEPATVLRLTGDHFDPRRSAKVAGAWHLHTETANDALDFFVVFSSGASLLGFPGQASYNADNAFLDALCEHRRVSGKPALSIAWGQWADIGMAARHDAVEMITGRGLSPIDPEQGFSVLGDLLGAPTTQVAFLPISFRRWFQFAASAAGQPFYAEIAPTETREESTEADSRGKAIRAADASERGALVFDLVVETVAKILQAPTSSVRGDLPIAEMGIDSLMALQLRNRLEEALGTKIQVVEIWNHPTAQKLAAFLTAALDTTAAPRAPSPREAPAIATNEPIAIVGIACRFPGGASSPEKYWRLLRDGVDAIVEVPRDRWDVDAFYDPDPTAPGKMNTRWGGFIRDIANFDPGFFGISSREARAMDPQQRLALEVTYEAILNAGHPASELSAAKTGVFLGVGVPEYSDRLDVSDPDLAAYAVTGNALSVIANRVSYAFDLHGPSMAIDTACSSSLVAVHVACESLRRGESDIALAGGVNAIASPRATIGLTKINALSPDGRCRTFDARANGYVRGEGCGMIVLKRLSKAIADGDRIWAVIHGSATAQDGRSTTLTAPNGLAQEAVIRAAHENAGVSPDAIGYVEAHGTGTPLGDPIELVALGKVIAGRTDRTEPVAVGAVKTNLGHLEAAAGIAGLIKVALAAHHGELPPSLHFETPNPNIPFEELGLRVQTSLGSWPRGRVAGVSAFGFGGTVAHAIIGAAPAETQRVEAHAERADSRHRISHALPLSASSPEALVAYASAFADCLERGVDGATHADVCMQASVGRDHQRHRLVVVGDDTAELARKLRAADVGAIREVPAQPPKVAFVFAGQGSQSPGMGRALLATERVFREAVERCAAAIQPHVAWSLLDELAKDAATSRVGETEIAQPALFAIQVGLAAMWRAYGVAPDMVVGHSVGEIAAAHVAGILDLEAAARLAVIRGRLMQRATGLGKMAHVELSLDEAREAVASAGGEVAVGASNGPRSTVLSGSKAALDQVLGALEARGIYTKRLQVDYAFHSSQLDPFVPELEESLAWLRPETGRVRFYSTLTGDVVRGEELRATYWAKQMREPVRFHAAAQKVVANAAVILEIGPHPVLGAAIEDTARDVSPALEREPQIVASMRRDVPERATFLEGLGAAHCAGVAVTWSLLHTADDSASPPTRGRHVELPSYPWQHERYWAGDVGANATTDADADAVNDRAWEVRWQAASRTPAGGGGGRADGAWILIGGGETGADLTRALRARGDRVIEVAAGRSNRQLDADRVELDPATDDAFAALFTGTLAGVALRGVVHLGALDAPTPDEPTLDDLVTAQRVGLHTALRCVQALARLTRVPRMWIVTRGAQAPAGAAGRPSSVAMSPLWGFGATVGNEVPELKCTLVDLDPEAVGGAELLAEIVDADEERQIALRAGTRFVARLAAATATLTKASSFAARSSASYLVTGGLRGLGLRVAGWLVGVGARHLVLFGRSAPDEEAERAIEAMRAAGARVVVHLGDVADGPSTIEAVATARTLAPLRGVFHCAGVLDDGVIDMLTPARFEAVARPKMLGGWNLHQATRDDSLDAFVLFSSLSAIIGNLGQASYTAANAFLDALARMRRASGRPALSVAWGPWAEVGMAARGGGTTTAMSSAGFEALQPENALALLGRAVSSNDVAHLALARADFRRWTQVIAAAGTNPFYADVGGTAQAGDTGVDAELLRLVEQLRGAPPVRKRDLARGLVGRVVARLLKLPDSKVPTSTPLMSVGVDSLMGLKLRNVLERLFEVRIAAVEMYNHTTVSALADHLLTRLEPAVATPPKAEPAPTTSTTTDSHSGAGDESLTKIDAELVAALATDSGEGELADELRDLLEAAEKLPEIP